MVIVLVLGAVIGVCYLVLSVLAEQLIGFIGEIPQMWESLQNDFARFGLQLNSMFKKIDPEISGRLDDLGDMIGTAISNFVGNTQAFSVEGVSGMVGSIANVIIGVVMCLLSAYFFLADREYMVELAERIVPESIRHKYDIFYNSMKRHVFQPPFLLILCILHSILKFLYKLTISNLLRCQPIQKIFHIIRYIICISTGTQEYFR